MKDDRIYLLHIRDAIQHILTYTTSGKDGFFADRKTQDAVIRNLKIMAKPQNASPPPSRMPTQISRGNPSPVYEISWCMITSA